MTIGEMLADVVLDSLITEPDKARDRRFVVANELCSEVEDVHPGRSAEAGGPAMSATLEHI